MNLKFLGDAHDHWKGSLLEFLQVGRVLDELAVDPMASDLWEPEDFNIFARLLRITPEQIIRHEVTLKDREKYFKEISHQGDIFLDPDTGVATGRVKDRCCYVEPNDIRQLLDRLPKRLVAVYQHVRGQQVPRRIDSVLAALKKQIGDFSWCSYDSANVAMLFLSRRAERTRRVTHYFANLLGRHAAGRIRC